VASGAAVARLTRWRHVPNGVIVSAMTKADEYRKRSGVLRNKTKKRQSAAERGRVVRKAKALDDMADNEDWLAGRTKPKKAKKPKAP
jgi:hypothetical protein